MPRSSSLLRGTATVGVIVALVSGCGPGPEYSSPDTASPEPTSPAATSPDATSPGVSSSPAEEASRVCVAADAFAGALTGFKDILQPGVRSGDIRAARDQVEETYEDLVDASTDAAQDRVDAVESATDDFRAAVDAIPEGASVSEAVDSLRAEASQVQTALRGLTSELGC